MIYSVYLAENEPWPILSLIPNAPLRALSNLGEWAWVGRVYRQPLTTQAEASTA